VFHYILPIYFTDIFYRYNLPIYFTDIFYRYILPIYFTDILYRYTLWFYTIQRGCLTWRFFPTFYSLFTNVQISHILSLRKVRHILHQCRPLTVTVRLSIATCFTHEKTVIKNHILGLNNLQMSKYRQQQRPFRQTRSVGHLYQTTSNSV
jgi:hypothetical protein